MAGAAAGTGRGRAAAAEAEGGGLDVGQAILLLGVLSVMPFVLHHALFAPTEDLISLDECANATRKIINRFEVPFFEFEFNKEMVEQAIPRVEVQQILVAGPCGAPATLDEAVLCHHTTSLLPPDLPLVHVEVGGKLPRVADPSTAKQAVFIVDASGRSFQTEERVAWAKALAASAPVSLGAFHIGIVPSVAPAMFELGKTLTLWMAPSRTEYLKFGQRYHSVHMGHLGALGCRPSTDLQPSVFIVARDAGPEVNADRFFGELGRHSAVQSGQTSGLVCGLMSADAVAFDADPSHDPGYISVFDLALSDVAHQMARPSAFVVPNRTKAMLYRRSAHIKAQIVRYVLRERLRGLPLPPAVMPKDSQLPSKHYDAAARPSPASASTVPAPPRRSQDTKEPVPGLRVELPADSDADPDPGAAFRVELPDTSDPPPPPSQPPEPVFKVELPEDAAAAAAAPAFKVNLPEGGDSVQPPPGAPPSAPLAFKVELPQETSGEQPQPADPQPAAPEAPGFEVHLPEEGRGDALWDVHDPGTEGPEDAVKLDTSKPPQLPTFFDRTKQLAATDPDWMGAVEPAVFAGLVDELQSGPRRAWRQDEEAAIVGIAHGMWVRESPRANEAVQLLLAAIAMSTVSGAQQSSNAGLYSELSLVYEAAQQPPEVMQPVLVSCCAGKEGGCCTRLGDLHMRVGQYDEAGAAYESGLALDPQRPATHNMLGASHFLANRLPEAERAFAAGLARFVSDPGLLLNQGKLFLQIGKLPQAEELLMRLLGVDPDNALAKKALADVYTAIDAV